MATWVRTGTGTAPSATDANLSGQVTLDTATAPADFDPNGVTNVNIAWRLTIAGLGDDSWTDHRRARLRTAATVELATVDIADATRSASGDYDSSGNDATPTSGRTIAEWEGATVDGVGTWATFNQSKGKDGSTASIPVANVVVTITYTPQTNFTDTGQTPAPLTVTPSYGTEFLSQSFSDLTGVGEGYLNLPNASDSVASTADKAQLDITGDIEVIALISATDWQGGAESPGWFLNKFGSSATRSYALGFSSTSLFQWGVNDGSTTHFPTASGAVQTVTGVADGEHLWVRARIDVNDGAGNADATFDYSLDPISTAPTSVSWTSWSGGANFTTAFTINATANDLELGRFDSSNSGTWDGKIYYVGLYDGWQGAGGTLVAETDWRAEDVTSDGLGNTWARSGSATYVAGGGNPAPLTFSVSYGTETFSQGNNFVHTGETAAPLTVTPSFGSESATYEERGGTASPLTLTVGYATETVGLSHVGETAAALTVTPSYATESFAVTDTAATAAPVTFTVTYGTEIFSLVETGGTPAALTVTVSYVTESQTHEERGGTAAPLTVTPSFGSESAVYEERGGSVASVVFTPSGATESANYVSTAETAAPLTLSVSFGTETFGFNDTEGTPAAVTFTVGGTTEGQVHEERNGNVTSLTLGVTSGTENVHWGQVGETAAPLTFTVTFGTETFSGGGTAYDETGQAPAPLVVTVSSGTEGATYTEVAATAAPLTLSVSFQTEGVQYPNDVGATAAALTVTPSYGSESAALSEVGGNVVPLNLAPSYATENVAWSETGGVPVTLTVSVTGTDGIVASDVGATPVSLVFFVDYGAEFYIPAGSGGGGGGGQVAVRGEERFPRNDVEQAYRKRHRIFRSGVGA